MEGGGDIGVREEGKTPRGGTPKSQGRKGAQGVGERGYRGRGEGGIARGGRTVIPGRGGGKEAKLPGGSRKPKS